jgi:hypothetical protein
MRGFVFRDISFAPKDGTVIEVRHGPTQEIVRAEWAAQTQAWILKDDPLRRTLHQVTEWRPVA